MREGAYKMWENKGFRWKMKGTSAKEKNAKVKVGNKWCR